MTKTTLLSAMLASTIALAATSFPVLAAGPKPLPIAEIKAENAKWAAAFKRGDYKTIGTFYTADGAMLPPGGDRVVGPAAITRFFAQGYAGKKPDTVTFSDYEFYGDEHTVTEVSRSDIHGPDGKLKSRGKQILIFVKQGAAWKLHRDIWNDDAPVKPGDR